MAHCPGSGGRAFLQELDASWVHDLLDAVLPQGVLLVSFCAQGCTEPSVSVFPDFLGDRKRPLGPFPPLLDFRCPGQPPHQYFEPF